MIRSCNWIEIFFLKHRYFRVCLDCTFLVENVFEVEFLPRFCVLLQLQSYRFGQNWIRWLFIGGQVKFSCWQIIFIYFWSLWFIQNRPQSLSLFLLPRNFESLFFLFFLGQRLATSLWFSGWLRFWISQNGPAWIRHGRLPPGRQPCWQRRLFPSGGSRCSCSISNWSLRLLILPWSSRIDFFHLVVEFVEVFDGYLWQVWERLQV